MKNNRKARQQLQEGYNRSFEEDKKIAEAWFFVDEEAWKNAGL